MTQELNLVGLNELVQLDRWALERRARALATAAYIGDDMMLCRVVGRYKLYVDSRDVGFGAHVLLDGIWEPWLTHFIATRLKEGMAVADLGANHGYYTLLMADLVGPTGRVAAVEPNPRMCELLRRSLVANGFNDRTEVMPFAATAEDVVDLKLLVPDQEPKNGRLVQIAHPEAGDAIDARGLRMSTLLRKWPRLDFVKIDVEGSEEDAIAGMMPLIERDRPSILLEFNIGRCRDAKGLLERLLATYGMVQAVDFESGLQMVDLAALLDTSHVEDWALFFSGKA